jgi:hypothetical protein
LVFWKYHFDGDSANHTVFACAGQGDTEEHGAYIHTQSVNQNKSVQEVRDVDEATLTVVWRIRIVRRETRIFASLCPSARMYHRGSHWSEFIETILLGALRVSYC